VHRLLATGMVSNRMIGFIVALPWMYSNLYNRTSKLMKIAEKYAQSNYIGTIGLRETFLMKVLDVSKFKKTKTDTTEEEYYIYRLSDRLGNFGFFFSKYPPSDVISNTECLPIKIWDCFEMKATPKKMGPNKETGIKETQFADVIVTEFIGPGSEE
jgi:hypothetical protein